MNLDDALAPTGNVFKYKILLNEGDSIQGVLQSTPEISAHQDFKTKQQAVTSGGKPKWQMKVVLKVKDENKTLYLQDKAYWAAVNAFRDAKSAAEDAEEPFEYRGGMFGLKRGDDKPSETPGFAPSKSYTAKFIAPKE